MRLISPQLIAKLGLYLHPLIIRLPNRIAVKIYSLGKYYFMRQFYKHLPNKINVKSQPRILWGLTFKLPLMNAAGMFKNGEGYQITVNQGAGAYIGGTSTHNARDGNTKLGIHHPFIVLPDSGLSLNFMGLPNLGDECLSQQKFAVDTNYPLGWSVMRSSDYEIDKAMQKLVESLWLYHNNPAINFIEINESCPNIPTQEQSINETSLTILENRLRYISRYFLQKRKRHLPVILKLSNNLQINQIAKLLDVMFACRFDGINIGNTSTNYSGPNFSNEYERYLFDYFTQNIGGGIGGLYLKDISLALCSKAVEYVRQTQPGYEFHVIRCGGVSCLQDIIDSDNAGISLNQWYTGYFENYIKYGDQLYAKMFNHG